MPTAPDPVLPLTAPSAPAAPAVVLSLPATAAPAAPAVVMAIPGASSPAAPPLVQGLPSGAAPAAPPLVVAIPAGAAGVAASLTLGASESSVIYTAKDTGPQGNDITVEQAAVDTGATAIAVSVTGKAIKITPFQHAVSVNLPNIGMYGPLAQYSNINRPDYQNNFPSRALISSCGGTGFWYLSVADAFGNIIYAATRINPSGLETSPPLGSSGWTVTTGVGTPVLSRYLEDGYTVSYTAIPSNAGQAAAAIMAVHAAAELVTATPGGIGSGSIAQAGPTHLTGGSGLVPPDLVQP